MHRNALNQESGPGLDQVWDQVPRTRLYKGLDQDSGPLRRPGLRTRTVWGRDGHWTRTRRGILEQDCGARLTAWSSPARRTSIRPSRLGLAAWWAPPLGSWATWRCCRPCGGRRCARGAWSPCCWGPWPQRGTWACRPPRWGRVGLEEVGGKAE